MAKLLDHFIYDKSLKAYNELAEPGKKAHFRPMAGLQSHDPVVQEMGKIRILQIGAVSAVDVNYFPRNTLLTVVDPNPDFEQNIRDELERNPGPVLQCYVVCQGEDMRHIADESMDAVVTTSALSRAENTKNMLAEIVRVLATGGKYFFWEPVDLVDENPLAGLHHPGPKSPSSPAKDGSASPSSPTPKSPSTGIEKNPFIFQRQFSTEVVQHSRTEIREPTDHGALSNLKTLANVAFGRRGSRKDSLTAELTAQDQVSNEERLIRLAGFKHVTAENFLLDDPKDEELQKKGWMQRRMSLSVPKHWHMRGVAEK